MRFFNRSKDVNWSDVERFNPEWIERIKIMAEFIPENSTVLDLGCGPQWLKKFLSKSQKYLGVDYKKRGQKTIICDLNKDTYPSSNAEIAFVSGCLEYIEEPKQFIKGISENQIMCILSYCLIEDFHDISFRESKAWKNNLSKSEIIDEFELNGMKLEFIKKTKSLNTIFVFKKI